MNIDQTSDTLIELGQPGSEVMDPTCSTNPRGGPRNSDSLLRWNPDQGKGVWNATEETELSR